MLTPILPLLLLATTPEISWTTGRLDDALTQARGESRGVFVYFWSDASQQCANTWKDSITSARGQDELDELVCFSARIGDGDTAELIGRFNVQTLPTMLVLAPDGSVEDALLGYHAEGLFVFELQRVKNGTDTVSDRRSKADFAPDDLRLRFELAAKLDHVGAKEESKALYESIKTDDALGETPVGARLHLWDVMQEIVDAAPSPSDLAAFDLEPMHDHLRRVKVEEVVFEGWEWIIEIERNRANREAVRKSMRKAWKHVPDNRRVRWGLDASWSFWEEREELAPAERKFALDVALACADEVQQLEEERVAAGSDEREEYDLEPLDVLACAYLLNRRAEEALATAELSVERNGSTPERDQMLARCRTGRP